MLTVTAGPGRLALGQVVPPAPIPGPPVVQQLLPRRVQSRDTSSAGTAALTSTLDSAAAQVFGQLGSGAMEPGFDGADRPGDGPGDLVVRQILLVEQDKDQAIFGPEPLQGPLELAGQVVGIGRSGSGVDAIFAWLDRSQAWAVVPDGPARSGNDWRRSLTTKDGSAALRRTPPSPAARE